MNTPAQRQQPHPRQKIPQVLRRENDELRALLAECINPGKTMESMHALRQRIEDAIK